MCGCAYPQEILIQFFFQGVMPLFELKNLTKIKDTTQNNLSAQLYWNCSTEFPEGAIYIPFELWPKLFCATQMKLVFRLIARRKCLELPFVVYSILKQCWSVGYACSLFLPLFIADQCLLLINVCCWSLFIADHCLLISWVTLTH